MREKGSCNTLDGVAVAAAARNSTQRVDRAVAHGVVGEFESESYLLERDRIVLCVYSS